MPANQNDFQRLFWFPLLFWIKSQLKSETIIISKLSYKSPSLLNIFTHFFVRNQNNLEFGANSNVFGS
jgi:hypothetical protein